MDPLLPMLVSHPSFRTFLDFYMIFFNEEKGNRNDDSILNFFLHIVSLPELCRSFCFGNNLLIMLDILLRRIRTVNFKTDEV